MGYAFVTKSVIATVSREVMREMERRSSVAADVALAVVRPSTTGGGVVGTVTGISGAATGGNECAILGHAGWCWIRCCDLKVGEERTAARYVLTLKMAFDGISLGDFP